jgi:hypothetical protein
MRCPFASVVVILVVHDMMQPALDDFVGTDGHPSPPAPLICLDLSPHVNLFLALIEIFGMDAGAR